MVDPKIVFPEIEQAEPDPDFPILRPGGGPVAAGDAGPAQRSVRSGPAAPGTEIRSVPDRPRFHAQWRRSLGRPAFRQRWSHAADRGWPADRRQRLLHHRSDARLAERQSAEPRRARPRGLGPPARPCGAHDRIRGQAAQQQLATTTSTTWWSTSSSAPSFRRHLLAARSRSCSTLRSPTPTARLSAKPRCELSGLQGDALAFEGSLAGTGVESRDQHGDQLGVRRGGIDRRLCADPGERGAGARADGRPAANRALGGRCARGREQYFRGQRRSERRRAPRSAPRATTCSAASLWSTTRSPVLMATTSCSATLATTFWTAARVTTSWMAAQATTS